MKKKKFLISTIIVLAISFTAVCTLAYYIDFEKIVNVADSGDSYIEVIEEFEPPKTDTILASTDIKKVVQIKNVKDESYVRCLIEFSDSRYEDKTVIDYDDKNWEKLGRYWYYKKPLKTGELTTPIMTNVHFTQNVPSDFDIIVYAESVQSEGYNDYVSAFNAIT